MNNIKNFSWSLGVTILYCTFFVINVKAQTLGKQNFSCEGRPSGYYADIDAGCQIYHMCDGLGRQFSYSCPNTTLFQQRMLICDHWYMVNCSKSEGDYAANLLIGQRGKPFVEDDAENPYHRTPRPDLLAHPSAAEYNIVYRMAKSQQPNNRNLVGASNTYEGDVAPTNEPAYFLPSHWSTEYYKSTTDKPSKIKSKGDPFAKKTFIGAKSTTPQAPQLVVNFRSNFKATTPVYPKAVPTEVPIADNNFSGESDANLILQPPFKSEDDIVINFPSKFQATTPVYPKFVETDAPLASQDTPPPPNSRNIYGISSIVEPPKETNIDNVGSVVNFESKFKATTPVYPKYVTPEVPLAVEDINNNPNVPNLSSVIQPPKSFQENEVNTLLQPSFSKNQKNVQQVASQPSNFQKNWKELQQTYLIPDYQFPLDVSAVRPGYDEGPSSFQVNPFNYVLMPRQHAAR